MTVYLSDITFRRALDGSANDLIGTVSVTVDQRRHLSKLEIRRSADGTPFIGETPGNTTKLLRAVRAHERRLFQVQLFAELRKRGVDVAGSANATAGSPHKSDPAGSDAGGGSPSVDFGPKNVGGGP